MMTDGILEAEFYACLGRTIEAKRKDRRLTQIEVAALVGVHRNTVSRWESGEMRMDLRQLLRLADVLSCNHIMLLPPRVMTWGDGFAKVLRERDPLLRQKEIA